MLKDIANLHAKCFPEKPWSSRDFEDLKKSGCEIIASQNGFIVYRKTLDEAEIITIGVHPDARRTGIASAMLGIIDGRCKHRVHHQYQTEARNR
ncbi:MAG: GNAT family N-acetyltransferase [Alphaproteobacteria bacterium]|nr:GNAT family N-acetyltransferase [Alphaproteobacteria bacterium]